MTRPHWNRAVLVAVALAVVALLVVGKHRLRDASERGAAAQGGSGSDKMVAPAANGGAALTRRLDRHWEVIAEVQRRKNPDGFAFFNPPATEAQIAAAERAVGFDFPAELRWLLRRHNGQDSSELASFINGHWLIDAERIAEDYEIMKSTYEHLEIVAARDERPARGESGNWWPELIAFAADAGGGEWYIDARTSLVYTGDPGSGIAFKNVAGEDPEAPLTFTAWMKDYAQRLAESKYWLDPSCPGILWMWHLDHFREP